MINDITYCITMVLYAYICYRQKTIKLKLITQEIAELSII